MAGSSNSCARIGLHIRSNPAPVFASWAVIHDERFFRRAITGGDVGIGESYMDGDWTSPDLVPLVRLATRNLRRLDSQNRLLSGIRRIASRLLHRLRDNSVSGSRKNIRAHLPIWGMTFTSFFSRCSDGVFLRLVRERRRFPSRMPAAQTRPRSGRKLRIEPGDRVLEIGCGWGGLSRFMRAKHYGAHVTGVNISHAQFSFANERISRETFLSGNVQLLLEDYRGLQGQFDKIVSIEMFEAVGLQHYDEFFLACDRLLSPDGSMLLQTITMTGPGTQQISPARRLDFKPYIFPRQ